MPKGTFICMQALLRCKVDTSYESLEVDD